MSKETLIQRIDDYARAANLAPSTICQYATSNRLVYARLKSGGSCTLETAEKLLTWMRDNPPANAPLAGAS